MNTVYDSITTMLRNINTIAEQRYGLLFRKNDHSDSPIYALLLSYLICANFDIRDDFRLNDLTPDTKDLTSFEYSQAEARAAMFCLKEYTTPEQHNMPVYQLREQLSSALAQLLFENNCICSDYALDCQYFNKSIRVQSLTFRTQLSDSLKIVSSGKDTVHAYYLLSRSELIHESLAATDYLYLGILLDDHAILKHRALCTRSGTDYWLQRFYEQDSFEPAKKTSDLIEANTSVHIRSPSRYEIARCTLAALYDITNVDDALGVLCDSSSTLSQVISVVTSAATTNTINPEPTPSF